jgi:hypothetical protein
LARPLSILNIKEHITEEFEKSDRGQNFIFH